MLAILDNACALADMLDVIFSLICGDTSEGILEGLDYLILHGFVVAFRIWIVASLSWL